jgi:hypothetical protein
MNPGITPEQQRLLDAFVGTWLGDETIYPSPWDPNGAIALARTQSRPVLDGLLVCTDYAEERDGEVVFRGHGLYGWDAAQRRYAMYWFDSMTPAPRNQPALGQWQGERLVFQAASEHADHRYVYEFKNAGYYEFRIETRQRKPDAEWVTFMRGEYSRQ